MRVTGESLSVERGGRRVLSALSFRAAAGELVAITGANGAGKTTLIRVIAGLISPVSGRIAVEGGDAELSIGQQSHLIGHQHGVKLALTVAENLRFFADFLGGAAVEKGLEAFGLAQLARFPAGVLSAGQRRRLSLSRLVIAPRPIWLLDEPTAGLDQASLRLLARHMERHLKAGGIILAATHGGLGLEPSRVIRLGEAA